MKSFPLLLSTFLLLGSIVDARSKKSRKDRKLFADNGELQTGSLYVQQLENTNANMNEMMGHNRLQQNMKRIGQWFGDIEERLDDFRDGVARKLNELHMSLQRPKIPMLGPAAMMLHPNMNPLLPNTVWPVSRGLTSNFSGPTFQSHSNVINQDSNVNAQEVRDQADDISEERRRHRERRLNDSLLV